MRQFYERVNAGDIDGFAALIADDMIEHEKIEGLPQTKEGVSSSSRCSRAAFPDLRMDAEDVIVSGDTAWARVRITGTNDGRVHGHAGDRASPSTSRPSTSCASTTKAWPPSTGASPTR